MGFTLQGPAPCHLGRPASRPTLNAPGHRGHFVVDLPGDGRALLRGGRVTGDGQVHVGPGDRGVVATWTGGGRTSSRKIEKHWLKHLIRNPIRSYEVIGIIEVYWPWYHQGTYWILFESYLRILFKNPIALSINVKDSNWNGTMVPLGTAVDWFEIFPSIIPWCSTRGPPSRGCAMSTARNWDLTMVLGVVSSYKLPYRV